MLEITLLGIKIRLSFMFFAVITAMTLIDRTGIALMGFASCILHELGHISAFLIIKTKPRELCFEVAGIKLVNPHKLLSLKSELFVLSAGCLVNLILGAIFYQINLAFSLTNISIGFFNLLPVISLDGGKMIFTILCMKLDIVKSHHILTAVSFLCLVPLILFGGLLFIKTHNLTLIITSLYLIGLLIFKSKD